MKIEILGAGCPKCHSTEANVRKALAELNKTAEVVEVTDIMAIIDKGVIQTPGLIINGKIIMQGKIPTVEQIKQFIQKEEGNG
ncbi:MAG TPA: thioredoxin family protein [Candidatus Omnitrophota bacterium]|nr:thioredoxin family protein [Candidatus Omnitrophota bacterium]HRZ14767.1 thioredoxin family protein [Candidatus Omnitrophota bacterium]